VTVRLYQFDRGAVSERGQVIAITVCGRGGVLASASRTSSEPQLQSGGGVIGEKQPSTAVAESPVPEWSGLCRVGGFAAFVLIAYTLATLVQLMLLGGQPGTAAEAFSLLQHHKIVGLLRLDLPTILFLPLYYLLFLGLCTVLYQTSRAQVTIGTSLVFVGVTLILATPTALSMIPLSEKFAAATTEAAKGQFLAAGEAILAADIWHSTGAIIGGILAQCGALLTCVVMLRDKKFGKIAAYVGIVMHSLDLTHIVLGPFLPIAGIVLMAVAGPLYPVWFFLVGKRLLELGRTRSAQWPSVAVLRP
jgi:hypothetical protein